MYCLARDRPKSRRDGPHRRALTAGSQPRRKPPFRPFTVSVGTVTVSKGTRVFAENVPAKPVGLTATTVGGRILLRWQQPDAKTRVVQFFIIRYKNMRTSESQQQRVVSPAPPPGARQREQNSGLATQKHYILLLNNIILVHALTVIQVVQWLSR